MKTRRRFDLIPWSAIREASHILDMGAVKHGLGTWRTISIETHLDCAMSHIGYWIDGKKVDDESGRSHLQHAFIRVMFAVALELIGIGTGDLPHTSYKAPSLASSHPSSAHRRNQRR